MSGTKSRILPGKSIFSAHGVVGKPATFSPASYIFFLLKFNHDSSNFNQVMISWDFCAGNFYLSSHHISF